MTENGRAHPSSDSIPDLRGTLERTLISALKAKLIDERRFKLAMKNVEKGNFFIVTVGTGAAYDAVIQEVRNGQPGEPRRVRRGEIEQTDKDPSGKDRR